MRALLCVFLYILAASSIEAGSRQAFFEDENCPVKANESCFPFATCTHLGRNYACQRKVVKEPQCLCNFTDNVSMVCVVGNSSVSLAHQRSCHKISVCDEHPLTESCSHTITCFSQSGYIRYNVSCYKGNFTVHNLKFCTGGSDTSDHNEPDNTTPEKPSDTFLRISVGLATNCTSNITFDSIDLIPESLLYDKNLNTKDIENSCETECGTYQLRKGSFSSFEDISRTVQSAIQNVSETSKTLILNSTFFLVLVESNDQTNISRMLILLANMTSTKSASCYSNISSSARNSGFTTAIVGERGRIEDGDLKMIAGDKWFLLGDDCDKELTTLGLVCLIHNLTANASSQDRVGFGYDCGMSGNFIWKCNDTEHRGIEDSYNCSCKNGYARDGFRCLKSKPCSSHGSYTTANARRRSCSSHISQLIENATTTKSVETAIQELKLLSETSSEFLQEDVLNKIVTFITGITDLLENGNIEVSPVTFEDIAGITSASNNGYFQQPKNQPSSIGDNTLRNKLTRALSSIALRVQLDESSTNFSFNNALADFQLEPEVRIIESFSDDVRVIVPSSAVAKSWGIPSNQSKRIKREGVNKERKSAFIFYKDDSLFYSNKNVSTVVSVGVGLNGGVKDLSEPVRIQHPNQLSRYGKSPIENDTLKMLKTTLLCAYWDYKQEDWLTDGCCLNLSSKSPECLCNHLTNFALIVKSENVPADAALSIVSDVGCAISIVGLFATVLIHVVSPELRKRRPAKILIQICVNLCIANVIFVSGTTHALNSKGWCYVVAFLLHYFLLVTWCWMSVYTYDMHNSLVKVFTTAKSYYLRKLAAIAYGLPALIATMTAAVALGYYDQQNSNHLCESVSDPNAASTYVAENVCWLKSYSLYLGFLAPVGVMLLYNMVIFFIVFREIALKTKVQSSASRHTNKQRFMVAVTMATFIGLNWVFGFFVLFSEDQLYISVTSWIFALLNIFQGFGIFLLTVVRRAEIRKVWWNPLKSRASIISTRVITAVSKTKDDYVVTQDTNKTTTITDVSTEITEATEAQKKEYFVEVQADVSDTKKEREVFSQQDEQGESSKGAEINESKDTKVQDDNKQEARSWLYRTLETKI